MQAIFEEILNNATKRVYRITFYNGETAVATFIKETQEYQYSGYEEREYVNLYPDKIEQIIRKACEDESKSREKYFTTGQLLHGENACSHFYFISVQKIMDNSDILKYGISYSGDEIQAYAWIDRRTGLFSYEGEYINLGQKNLLENIFRKNAYSRQLAIDHFATGCG
ncbi:hypothetical protein H7198_02755 [Fructobacillus sp. CRL 2054]|uniref:hypothetical protein n=1 Tax=Fructobacillus sp. CRL 2054 TaxID=2763007 RepID=UPI0023787E99|nr:hypothetical protein [Fructobacillus sp. CRL 2054]MDD9138534.1 hypothetical protein [Fructobacillus sp. CRL 2054]